MRQEYFDHNYIYMELGDGDELWENRRMVNWVRQNHQPLMAGHTHRPCLPKSEEDGWYFNCGSGVHPHSITAIELVQGRFFLVKWTEMPDEHRYVKIEKEYLAGPVPVEKLFHTPDK